MGITATQSQAAAAVAKLGTLQTAAGGSPRDSAALVSRLALLASTGHASAWQHAVGLSALGPLASVLHVTAINVNTAVITASLPALRAIAATSAVQAAQGRSALGALASVLRVQAINVNTGVIVVTLPGLRAAATGTASGSAHTVSRLPLATSGHASASQGVSGRSTLALGASLRLSVLSTAFVESTLGPLRSALSVQPAPLGYPGDPNFYLALPVRPFYATLGARPFYAQMVARSFYVLASQGMAQLFSGTKDPRETVVITLDASPDLAAGESLTGITKTDVTMQYGVDPNMANVITNPIINGTPVTVGGVTVASGHGVQAVATGAVSGCGYLVAITCTTSNPEKILTLKGVLSVSAA